MKLFKNLLNKINECFDVPVRRNEIPPPPPQPVVSPEYQVIINDLEKNWDKWEFSNSFASMYIHFEANRLIDGLKLSLEITSSPYSQYIRIKEPSLDFLTLTAKSEEGQLLIEKINEARTKKMKPIWDEEARVEKERKEKVKQDFNSIIEKLK